MEAPQEIVDALRLERHTFEIRWNPKAKLKQKGRYDADGKLVDPTWEGRFELWDTDPYGGEYLFMRLQTPEGGFRAPGWWLVERVKMLNPERWAGRLDKMEEYFIERPELLREAGTIQDSDDLIEAVGNWADWVATPKSGAALTFRGKRLESA
jgi:hypothetical protein